MLWTGEVIPKFSQTYTFTATTVGGDVLFIRPHGSSAWTTLVSDWTIHGLTADTASYAFTAGQTYDIELEYRQPTAGAAAECKLHWSSASTPDEAIEPATAVGVNFENGDCSFANMVNGGSRNYWWAPGNTSTTIATDSNFWPTADAEIFLGEGDVTLDSGGTYLIQFTGTATLTNSVGAAFRVGTTNYGGTLPAGAGRLHHKSRSDKDLCEIGFVPGSGEAFVLDPDFARRFVLQHCQCRAAEDAEVGVGMSLADATQVFLEGYVELPVQPVLDPPMAANRTCKATRGEVLAEDVIADVQCIPCHRAG